jgi:hypothetical protein
VSEREERESSTREYGPFKVPREALQPLAWSTNTPLPVTSRYGQNVYLADCPRLNSNGKNAKSTTGGTHRWVGRTVRQGHADRPPGPRGLSAERPRTVRLVPRAAPCSVKNNRPSAWGPRTVHPEAHFLKNVCQKSQMK